MLTSRVRLAKVRRVGLGIVVYLNGGASLQRLALCAVVVLAGVGQVVEGAVIVETVPVANLGNAGKQSRLASHGDATYYGAGGVCGG